MDRDDRSGSQVRWLAKRLDRRELLWGMGAMGLSLPLASGLLEACAGGSATVEAPSTKTKGDIVIWGWKDSNDALRLLDAGFQAAYPDINFKYVDRNPADTYRNIDLAISAGAGGPDVALIEDSHLVQYVQLGALADVTERVQPYLDQFDAYKWKWTKRGTSYHAMPWDPGPVAIFYRRDIFDKAGVDPASIKTWDDFHTAAMQIKRTTGVPMWQQAKARNDGRLFETLLWQQGSGYINDKGNVILDTDARVERTLEYIDRFWKDDLAADEEPWTDAWYGAQTNGNVATIPEAVWMGTFLKSWIAPTTGGKWGVFPLPTWSAGGSTASNDGGSALAIFETSKQKDAAWAYVYFHLIRPESQLAMYEKTDIFPSLKSSYKDTFFQQADDYYGGEKVRELFAGVAAKIPDAGIYSKDYDQMNRLLAPELQKVGLGQQSPAQALKNAASLIREKTRRS